MPMKCGLPVAVTFDSSHHQIGELGCSPEWIDLPIGWDEAIRQES